MSRDWFIVTGASGGIGQEITRALALKGFPIIMACRNLQKTEQIRDQIIRESGNPNIEMRLLELSSLQSVFDFVEALKCSNYKVKALINNAGIMCKEYQETHDHFEMTIGVNYIATYLLSRLLLPLMNRDDSRIINTTSCTYRIGKINETFFNVRPEHYHRFSSYANSKLAVLLFTIELASRLKTTGISVYAVDPGVVDTGMITMQRWFDPLADKLFRPFIKSPREGAETSVFLASQQFEKNKNDLLFSNCRQIKPAKFVFTHPYREKLWTSTEQLLSDYISPFNIP